ncbi:Fic/DOC family protein [Tsukamurella ocularis]|uniref:Fic/DOC family protein n=1 Tax=Tsukamurella ocularis TaxID=1970234 RepID=UPI002167651C|nr:Fic family protein [Tsukamurella ocularis]MCS3853298.1 cell filamentation protein [Tsukamurella ocularis]
MVLDDDENKVRFDALFYPGTRVLKNVPDLRDMDELARFEAGEVASRALELAADPDLVPRTHDLQQLAGIHHHLFQDVYPWAGLVRDVNIEKGGKPFAHFGNVRTYMEEVEYDLSTKRELRSSNRTEFSAAAAELFANVNHAHPFREGNGRAGRAFIESVLRDVSPTWAVDFEAARVDRDRWNAASHASRPDRGVWSPDPQPLLEIFDRASRTLVRGKGHSRERDQSAPSVGYEL